MIMSQWGKEMIRIEWHETNFTPSQDVHRFFTIRIKYRPVYNSLMALKKWNSIYFFMILLSNLLK